MAETDFFTEESLRRLAFDSPENAFSHIQIQAMKNGFEIATSQSHSSTYMTIYCTKGGRQKGANTTKTGCQWKIALKPSNGGVVIGKITSLQHNHQLTPDKYSVFTLPPDIQDLSRKMLNVGIRPAQIQRFLLEHGGHEISTLQIRKLGDRLKAFQDSETESLREYMESVGGYISRLTTKIDHKTHVHAVFTSMPFEAENLKRFGDVIFIDGTQRQNYLNWEIIPVTVIDQYKRIRSGGVFFVSRADHEVLEWVISTLLDNEDLKQNLQTIITDEDSAFIPAFDRVVGAFNDEIPDPDARKPIRHVLCAFHKEQNFLRKLARCGLTEAQREAAKDMFKIVCYACHRESCDDAIQGLRELSKKLSKYLDKHVVPILDKFARAYLSEVWTKGYNTTSPAESHNNMIKTGMRDGRIYTLKQMRIEITATHRAAEISFRDRIASSFTNTHFTMVTHGVMLSPKIRAMIDATIEQASSFCVSLDDHSVYHPDAVKYVYDIRDDACSCGRESHAGLPCPHLLAFMAKQGADLHDDFPIAQVSERWVIPDGNAVIIPIGTDGEVEEDSDEAGEETGVDCAEHAFPSGNPLDEPPEEADFGERDLITALTDKPRFLEQKERYLTLFHLGKQVASIGARSLEISIKLRDELKRMLEELLGLPETTAGVTERPSEEEEEEEGVDEEQIEQEIVDVRDVSKRGRGRPKKQLPLTERFRHTKRCILCGGAHSLEKCRKYRAFAEAVEHNESIEPGRGSRCSVCRGIGHNRKSCGWLWENQKK